MYYVDLLTYIWHITALTVCVDIFSIISSSLIHTSAMLLQWWGISLHTV